MKHLILSSMAFAFTSYAAIPYPLEEAKISSHFGLRKDPFSGNLQKHSGVDFAAPLGTPVLSIGYGKVIFAGNYSGYGNLVVISHSTNITTHYGHCQKILVSTGDIVRPGQKIALVGKTGRSTGAHLHFEIRRKGTPVDPSIVLPITN